MPPGLVISEEEIYADLLLRKPGQGELTSPRREPDVPVIYSGVNAADTMPGFSNKGRTNGTPFVILIPNLDRHFEHIDQYQRTNRTPRPGHASFASYQATSLWLDERPSKGIAIVSGMAALTASTLLARRADWTGRDAVFVQTAERTFDLRTVVLGEGSQDWVEIRSGLTEGEAIAVEGVFTLKSEVLKGSLEEHDH